MVETCARVAQPHLPLKLLTTLLKPLRGGKGNETLIFSYLIFNFKINCKQKKIYKSKFLRRGGDRGL
jgi:hypothetical protein